MPGAEGRVFRLVPKQGGGMGKGAGRAARAADPLAQFGQGDALAHIQRGADRDKIQAVFRQFAR